MDPSPDRAGIRELRQHASRYVELAAGGRTVDITNRGRVVARLVPAGDPDGPLADLIASGDVRPPDEEGDVLDIQPVAPSGRVTASEALREIRDDERW
ncbi:MAG: type II toxin-antitoxin system Phd/YefM family antitoxin [Acidimicrobiales bacterium]|nr:type II toxin-antitoxin system Phd/YefM family antitoxin [Acidimicrobiales bacterium]